MDADQAPSAKRRRTRNRQALACTACRHKKLRCDRQQPCNGCIRSKDKSNVCSYASAPAAQQNLNAAPVEAAAAAPTEIRQRVTTPANVAVARPSVGVGVGVGVGTRNTGLATTTAASSPRGREPVPGGDGVTAQAWFSSNVAELGVVTPPASSVPAQPTQRGTPASASASNVVPVIVSHASDPEGVSRLLEEKMRNPINAVMVKTRYLSPSSWLYSIILVGNKPF